MSCPDHDLDQAIALVREAYQRPRPLTSAEVDAWLQFIPYMGRAVRRGKRGPASKRVQQYDDASAWRKRVLQRHRLMASRAAVAAMYRRVIVEALDALPPTPRRRQVAAITDWLDTHSRPIPDRRTIERHLREIGIR